MAKPKAEQITENVLKFLVRNGLYIIAVIVAIFLLLWLYKAIFGGGGKENKTGAQVLEDFLDQTGADNPNAAANNALNIQEVAQAVWEMYQAYNLAGTGCTTSKGISYDVALTPILSMGALEVTTLCQYWNAEYKPKTGTTVLGIPLTYEKSIIDAIEYEKSGFLGCLTDTIKTAVIEKLKSSGCQ